MKLRAFFVRMFSFSKILTTSFVIIFSLFIALIALLYRNTKILSDRDYWVSHTYQVIENTMQVAALSKDIQWDSRTYLLMNDSNSAYSYTKIRDSLQSAVLLLVNSVSDNSEQKSRVAQLQMQVSQLINFIDESFAEKRSGNFSNNDFVENKLRQNIFHDEIGKQLDAITTEERKLLGQRSAANNASVSTIRNLTITICIIVSLLIPATFILIMYHLSRRKRAEKKVVESEKNFRLLVNSIKDLAIFMTDAKGNILTWHEGASNIKGYTNKEVIGKNISIFYTRDSIEKGEPQANLKEAALNGSFETEGWRIRKDGSMFWADVLITAIYDKTGKAQGFIKVTRDFTLQNKLKEESKLALEKERELNEMKSHFVTVASHEFRTPLSTILSSVALIRQYKTTEMQDKRDKHIARIENAVREMVHILEEFLSLEKIEQGKAEARKEMFNLKKYAHSLCEKLSIESKKGQVIESKHTGIENVKLDPTFIDHILTNFLTNAIKYSPENTTITLETSVNTDKIELIVRDQGIGISPADQKKLFTRFFRASNSGNVKGTGLGLHIVKRYVDLMGGTISVKSEIGKGSEFTVTINQ